MTSDELGLKVHALERKAERAIVKLRRAYVQEHSTYKAGDTIKDARTGITIEVHLVDYTVGEINQVPLPLYRGPVLSKCIGSPPNYEISEGDALLVRHPGYESFIK